MADKPADDIKNLNTDLSPIIDDPDTVKYLEGSVSDEPPQDDIKEPAPWESRMEALAESQKGIQDAIGQLAQVVAASQGRQEVVERVVERAPEPVTAPKKRPWEEKLKPEAVEVFKEAIADLLGDQLGQFKDQELAPALRYLIGTQDQLLEDRLASKYNDETFGYEALKEDVYKYRAATGNTMPLETAYRQVGFVNMMEAVMGSRDNKLQTARKQKRETPVDAGGGTPPGALDGEDVLDDAEKRSAMIFFGRDDKGKSRSPREAETIWLEQKKGAKRDMMVD